MSAMTTIAAALRLAAGTHDASLRLRLAATGCADSAQQGVGDRAFSSDRAAVTKRGIASDALEGLSRADRTASDRRADRLFDRHA